MTEFELIDRIRRRALQRSDVILGIGDDAAVLQVPLGKHLVAATDTLNAGVHFPEATAPADIGWKALAVNLSDLAAMGAEPAWCTLSLSLPSSDAAWLDGFLDGFLELAEQHRVALVGGDTTRGPLSICVTAHGLVEPGRALRRDGARPGDDVWVSGTLGDAAAALGGGGVALEALLGAALDDGRDVGGEVGGLARCHARHQVGGGRRHDDQVGGARQLDMAHLGLIGEAVKVGEHAGPAQARHRQGRDELFRRARHDAAHADAFLPGAPDQLQTLVGRDAAADDEQDLLAVQHVPGLRGRQAHYARDGPLARIGSEPNLVMPAQAGISLGGCKLPRRRGHQPSRDLCITPP
ncbi:MAG: thiamine-phosphate kinase, partial [Proteobacteria bacterium]|nr:thiamine-phosphate kinase [Pseudomonadota bacterium]